MARQRRPSIGRSSGATAEYSAAESITARSEMSHEAMGCGERNRMRIG